MWLAHASLDTAARSTFRQCAAVDRRGAVAHVGRAGDGILSWTGGPGSDRTTCRVHLCLRCAAGTPGVRLSLDGGFAYQGIRREPNLAETDTLLTRIGKAFLGETAAASEAVEKAQGSAMSTIGSAAVQQVGGIVMSADRDPLLVGDRRFETYDAMLRNTTIVAAGVRLFLNLLARAEWTVNPAEGEEDNPRAQEIADLAYDMMFDMTTPWSTVVRKQAMFRFQGFAIQEWTAKRRDDGNIGMMDVENRPQRSIKRWNLDRSNTVQGVFQQDSTYQEVELPRGKIIYSVDDTLTDSPEGLGLYRHLATTSHKLRSFLELEEIGYETDLRGIPIARAPMGELRDEVDAAGEKGADAVKAAEATRAAKLQPLKDFIARHIRNKKMGMVLPSDTYFSTGGETQTPSSVQKWALELLQGDSTSIAEMANAINRLNAELARVLGVEHLLLGADKSGSLALARSKVGTFYLTVTATLSELVEVFERDWLQPLADLNGWPPELVPSLGVQDINDEDITEIATVLMNMATAGAPLAPDDPAIGEVRDKLGLSRPPMDAMDLDASLNPGRKAPDDITGAAANQNVTNPEAKVQKMIWSKRSKVRRKRAEVRKRVEMRKAA
jgi:hypothetical protein